MLQKRTLYLYLGLVLVCTLYQTTKTQWTVPLLGATKKYSTHVIDTLKSWGFTDKDIDSITLSDPLRPLDDPRIERLKKQFGNRAFIALKLYPSPKKLGLRYLFVTPFSEADLLLLCNAHFNEAPRDTYFYNFPVYPDRPLPFLIRQTSEWLTENSTNPLFLRLIALFVINSQIDINAPIWNPATSGYSTTLLHMTVENPNLLPVVALLLTRDDIKLDQVNIEGLTPLQLAQQVNNQAAAHLLEERQRKQKNQEQTQQELSQSSSSESSYIKLPQTSGSDLALDFTWIAETFSGAGNPNIPDALAPFNNDFNIPRAPKDILKQYIDSRHNNHQTSQQSFITGKNIAIAVIAAQISFLAGQLAHVLTSRNCSKQEITEKTQTLIDDYMVTRSKSFVKELQKEFFGSEHFTTAKSLRHAPLSELLSTVSLSDDSKTELVFDFKHNIIADEELKSRLAIQSIAWYEVVQEVLNIESLCGTFLRDLTIQSAVNSSVKDLDITLGTAVNSHKNSDEVISLLKLFPESFQKTLITLGECTKLKEDSLQLLRDAVKEVNN